MKPSEYFLSQLLPLRRGRRGAGASSTSSAFGDDNLVFSTDYPHADSKYPHAVDEFLELPLSGGVEAQDPLGQLVPALRHAGAGRTVDPDTRSRLRNNYPLR